MFLVELGADSLAADPVREGARRKPAEAIADVPNSAPPKQGVGTSAKWNGSEPRVVALETRAVSSQAGREANSGDAEQSGGLSAPPIDVDDWDWSGVADTDLEPAGRAVRRVQTLTKKPRVGETAEPDFNRPVRPAHQLFPRATPFKVIASKKDRDMHPCLDCHHWAESDRTPRELEEPHDNFKLRHGLHDKGKFWCFTCHHLEGEGGLRTLEGEKLAFDDAYVICSQCHAQEARDWAFGSHGKRVGPWLGPRRVLNCTACHYQHRPRIKARKPMPGPKVRMGLERPAHWVAKDQRLSAEKAPKQTWGRSIGRWREAPP